MKLQLNLITLAMNEYDVNKYGVPVDVWNTLTAKERQRHYNRYSAKQRGRPYNVSRQAKDNQNASKRALREKYPEIWRAKDKARYRRYKDKKTITLSPDEVYNLINKAVSRALPAHIRDDVIAEICLAVLEGKLFIDDIKKEVVKYIRAHNREYDHFKTISLDATITGTDNLTRLDLLEAQPEYAELDET